jgi:cell division topological specificity factor
MNLISMFRRRDSAPVARERLQVLLAHERAFIGKSDLLAVLQEEIIAVIARHVTIERERVQIKLDRGDPISAGNRRGGAKCRSRRSAARRTPGDGGGLERLTRGTLSPCTKGTAFGIQSGRAADSPAWPRE